MGSHIGSEEMNTQNQLKRPCKLPKCTLYAMPRIEFSRASSSSPQDQDSRESSPDNVFEQIGRGTLNEEFGENGCSSDIRMNVPFIIGPHKSQDEVVIERKNSKSSEHSEILRSGRTSRLSSTGSQGSAISKLSAFSGSSRSPSPHRMMLETSFCGPKPLGSTLDDISSLNTNEQSTIDVLEKIVISREHDPRNALLAQGIQLNPKHITEEVVAKNLECLELIPKVNSPSLDMYSNKVIVGFTPSGAEYIRINLKPDHQYTDNGIAVNECILNNETKLKNNDKFYSSHTILSKESESNSLLSPSKSNFIVDLFNRKGSQRSLKYANIEKHKCKNEHSFMSSSSLMGDNCKQSTISDASTNYSELHIPLHTLAKESGKDESSKIKANLNAVNSAKFEPNVSFIPPNAEAAIIKLLEIPNNNRNIEDTNLCGNNTDLSISHLERKHIFPANDNTTNCLTNSVISDSVVNSNVKITAALKRKILFATRLGSNSQDNIFSTQFSISKTDSLSSELSVNISQEAEVQDICSIHNDSSRDQYIKQTAQKSNVCNVLKKMSASDVSGNNNQCILNFQRRWQSDSSISCSKSHKKNKKSEIKLVRRRQYGSLNNCLNEFLEPFNNEHFEISTFYAFEHNFVGTVQENEMAVLVPQKSIDDSASIKPTESFDDCLPFIPTTLPEEKNQGVPLIPIKERIPINIETCSLNRPRCTTHITPVCLREYCEIQKSSENHNIHDEKIRINLSRKCLGKKHESMEPISEKELQNWVNFEFIPERNKIPKRITTLPKEQITTRICTSMLCRYMCECQCDCHRKQNAGDTNTPEKCEDMEPLIDLEIPEVLPR